MHCRLSYRSLMFPTTLFLTKTFRESVEKFVPFRLVRVRFPWIPGLYQLTASITVTVDDTTINLHNITRAMEPHLAQHRLNFTFQPVHSVPQPVGRHRHRQVRPACRLVDIVSTLFIFHVPPVGFEPTTYALRVRSTAAVLWRRALRFLVYSSFNG